MTGIQMNPSFKLPESGSPLYNNNKFKSRMDQLATKVMFEIKKWAEIFLKWVFLGPIIINELTPSLLEYFCFFTMMKLIYNREYIFIYFLWSLDCTAKSPQFTA